MKRIIQHENLGEIIYEENAFTGNKTLYVGGVPLEKVSKKEFRLQDGSIATVNGGYIQGASLFINGETIELMPKIKWYEIVLCVLPFVLIMIWGNSTALVNIVPVVGGAIGGAVSAVVCFLEFLLVKPLWLKAVIAVVGLAVTFLICWGIGSAIVSALT